MQSFLRMIVTCALLVTPLFTIAQSQLQAGKHVPMTPISQAEISASVGAIATMIDEHYVYKEKGTAIAQHLLAQEKQRVFEHVRYWKEFDSLTNTILRSYSQDGHLYVRFSPEKVKALRERGTKPDNQHGADDFFYGEEARRNNYGFKEVTVLEGNTGYLQLSQINISRASLPVLRAAMKKLAGTRRLIIDLRGNGGGGGDTTSILESCFLPAGIPLLEFHNRKGEITIDSSVAVEPGMKYEAPVYVLINKGSASAAEALACVLQANHRAKIIGQPSAGAANHNMFYVVNDMLVISVSIEAPAIPGTKEAWEDHGVRPDIVTKEGEELRSAMQQL
ncbi:MAG TPA: S41 family peptidase [Chitinophaga sp.]|uniref:S41 family peptidase n=1 Tax=Chitinophaga sp. TaxID=1869181 RepID=UPI002CAF87D6|nr:S41 family peptidase [Chitinophaga sp.]HVI44625.1 S41 family peptidase [Chitinophaga sp.]